MSVFGKFTSQVVIRAPSHRLKRFVNAFHYRRSEDHEAGMVQVAIKTVGDIYAMVMSTLERTSDPKAERV
jgi:hypothetical protein